MGKAGLWIIVALAILIFARMSARKASKRQAAERQERRAASSFATRRDRQPETMVRCVYCGIHLPYSEALIINGQTWCGPEHARLGSDQN